MSRDFTCSGVQIISFAEFDKFHTKQLMEMRHNEPYPSYCEYTCEMCSRKEECEVNRKENYKTLREVLATRPHVLNKQESKALRKQRKKQGK